MLKQQREEQKKRQEEKVNKAARGMATVGKSTNQINSIWSIPTHQPSSNYKHQLDQLQRQPGFKKGK